MMELVQQPIARRLWRIAKQFGIPISDPRISGMTPQQLDFYELSIIADDPDLLDRYNNHYFDPDFDEWANEVAPEEETNPNVDQTTDGPSTTPDPNWDDYDISGPTGNASDWEKVDD